MHPDVFGAAWVAAWHEAINASAAYRAAAAAWEGAVVVVMDATNGSPQRAAWADLWHGECRSARAATTDDLATAPFVIAGTAEAWGQVLSGAMEPISAVMLGRLRLARGDLGRLVLQVPAARAMVEVAGEVTRRLAALAPPSPVHEP